MFANSDRIDRSIRARVLFGVLALFAGTAGAQTSFNGTGTGPIPDATAGGPGAFGAPLDISFAVSGIAGPLTNVSLGITATHSYIGDLDVVLAPPGVTPGAAGSFVIFSRVGAAAAGDFGDSSNLSGAYTFNNAATANIWTVATTACDSACNILAQPYRTVVAGPTANPAAATDLTAAFATLTSAQINGTWTLRLRDGANLDTGSVTAATLALTGTSLPLTSTPVSGSTVALGPRVNGGPAATRTLQFTNPNAAAATVTCTAPAATQFTVTPLTVNVPASGSASTTISFTSATVGTFSGTLNCTAGAQALTYTLSGSTVASAVSVDTFGPLGKLLLLFAVLGVGLVAIRRH